MPTRIFTLQAAHLSDSLIFWEPKPLGQTGFPAWDQKQLNNYGRIATVGAAECARDDHYYDAITTTYQLYARTGTLTHLVNARRWALHHRRDQVHLSGPDVGHGRCPGGYLNNTRYTFPQGLIQDFFMFGDEEARNVSALIVDNFYMPHEASWYYKAPTAAKLADFLKVIDDPASQPVYVHCVGGRHRTGVMTAVYRMTRHGWAADRAFREMKEYDFGADFLHPEFKTVRVRIR